MKKFVTIAAVAALTTLAACGTAEAPAEVTATEAVETEATNAVDPNLQQICDSQTPTAACDSEEYRDAQAAREATTPAADSK
jgi:hypothetical protein